MTQTLARQPQAAPPPAPHAWDHRLPWLLLLLVGAWLLSKPWIGLRGDAALYAVQALQLLHPEAYKKDLFFLFGSQSSFTLFSPLYAKAIAALGLERAAILVQVLGNLLWLAGAAALLRCCLRGYHFWLGLLLLVMLPSDYGPTPQVFMLADGLPTPRLLAEGLSMGALALALRGRWAWGGALLLLAGLLHPLMAHGALLVGVLYLAWGRWRLAAALAVAGAALLLLAALRGIAPFHGLLQTMDAAWLDKLAWMAPMVSWDAWHAGEWVGRTLMALTLVLAAAGLADGARTRFFGSVALAAVLGVLASWIGSGLLHNVLLIQVQPWRVLWLMHLAAAVALAWLLAAFWQRGRVFRLLLVALMVAQLNRDTFGGFLAPLAAWGLYWQVRRPRPLDLPLRTYRLALGGLAAIGSIWLLQWLDEAVRSYAGPYGSELGLHIWLALRAGWGAALGAGVLWCLWRWSARPQRAARVLAAGLVLAMLLASLLWFTQRAAASRHLSPAMQQAVQQHFGPLVPESAVVYWGNDVRASWFVLGRSNYASSAQVSGAVFNRGTALEGARRLALLRQLGMADGVREHDDTRRRLQLARLPQAGAAGLAALCADRALDFVVLAEPFGSGVVAQLTDSERDVTFYLHDCALQRASLASH
ncbi:hypothetical protein [Pseudoduganella sp. OTU4001]|uniref:hypothetical protein n=1 Tax=Pseudoduganella sp. OTU4001 TaxID=3043854 RepID=UPI00313EDA8F